MPAETSIEEDVFKFVSVRPPKLPSWKDLHGVRFVREQSGALTDFGKKVTDKEPEDAAKLAREFMESDKYVAHPERYGTLEKFLGLWDLAAGARPPGRPPPADAVPQPAEGDEEKSDDEAQKGTDAVAQLVGHIETMGESAKSVGEYVAKETFKKLESELWDGFHANVLDPRYRPQDHEPILRALRMAHMLRSIAASKDTLPSPVSDYADAMIVLPRKAFPRGRQPPLPGDKDSQNEQQSEEEGQPSTLPKEPAKSDDSSFQTPSRDAGPSLQSTEAIESHAEPTEKRPVERGGAEAAEAHAARKLQTLYVQMQAVRDELQTMQLKRPLVPTIAVEAPKPTWWKALVTRSPAPRPTKDSRPSRPRPTAEALQRLADLESSARVLISEMAQKQTQRSVYRLGTSYFSSSQLDGPWAGMNVRPLPPPRIRSIGVADLMLVRQTLLRYEQGEVAHIENVLQSEVRKRSHRRLSRREEELVRITEENKESERDLQSTDRFELQRETEQTIQSDASEQAGITVSGGFGPVTTTAHAEFASSSSQTESSRNSTTYARDVTERSVARLKERVFEQRTTRVLEEIEEINKHGFTNANGAAHIRGIYRWVDKVYRAQIINYGRRLMYEFIIAEPAAFYRYAEQHRTNEGAELYKPDPPSIGVDNAGNPILLVEPDQLDRLNYVLPVGRYNVSGISAPPPPYLIVATAFDQKAPQPAADIATKTAEIRVPPGYLATNGEFHASTYLPRVALWMQLYIGNNFFTNEDDWFGLNYETDNIPVTLMTNHDVVVGIEIRCDIRPETFARWRIDTFNAIMTAYQQQEREYREQVAAAQIRLGVAIAGRSPARNRELERDELKKGCIRIMSEQDFTEFDAMKSAGPNDPPTPADFPEFDITEAMKDGRKIQFFEQAFEWDQMTYLFYPYFWGKKDRWLFTRQLEDADPLFAKFLQAGAARVLVPVRLAFNQAVLHYMSSERPPDDPWPGGETPLADDPLYLSLADELREQTGGRDDGVPVGDPWEVRIPTTLVYLQDNAELPTFGE